MFKRNSTVNNVLKQISRRTNTTTIQNTLVRPLSYTARTSMKATENKTTFKTTPLDTPSTKLGTATSITHKQMSPQQILDTLSKYRSVGNIKGAFNLVRKAQENNTVTVAMYQQLLLTLLDSPLDIDISAFVASWFYSPQSPISDDIKKNEQLWHDVLKLGFRLGGTYRKEDLRVLVETFTKTFDVSTITDQQSLELLLRAYGILGKTDRISTLLSQLSTEPQYADLDRSSLASSGILAYASTGANQKVNELMQSLEKDEKLDQKLLQKLIRIYGFKGDLNLTQHYINICNQLYPDTTDHTTMQLIAHKAALSNSYFSLVKRCGTQGLPLKSISTPELDQLHASWNSLMAENKNKLFDITQCNVILEYLALANRIDPDEFPLSMAEQIVDEYMPAHDLKPNEMTWKTLLNAYATTSEFKYDAKHNIRLDKTLVVLSRMDEAGYHADQSCFHALFKACRPYLPGKGYIFDHFFLASKLTSALRFTPSLDHRIFELEKIMMSSKIPHDRTTIKLMLTCLGVTGQYQAMWNRWKLLKSSGLQRDMGLYQHVFSLASMDSEQSQYALAVTRNELGREIDHERIPWDTYVAMLDCAITAQMPDMATMIIDQMRQRYISKALPTTIANNNNDDTMKKSDLYAPLLRAYTSIPTLAPEVPKLLKEMETNQVPYNNPIWQYVMSHHLLHDDSGATMQNIQRTFNSFTMQRFEQQAKIPIPVRESSPIVPFPSGPYSANDMAMINMYIAALIDAQDVSLVFDVLRTLENQTSSFGLSRETIRGVVKLAKQEKSNVELSWLVHQVLPRVPSKNAEFRQWVDHLQQSVPK
ncbi:uncharacterized protein BX664DRAFT_382402 [Halteromyces radiatus]|uniref:uncharacterized protein n=1 Tax=Halteromyces radiatus TaxID=101107 RepID=UPI00221FB6DF|nr:uncharacterized protein BX664DRAFT_382402 [Halteromyces radiatus]KAI8099938.1 hypothetical protein BX664DRAFT_382402 [Halteromyces radiatus]